MNGFPIKLQKRESMGLSGIRPAFGGKPRVRWGKWTTLCSYDDQKAAVEHCDRLADKGGMDQYRVTNRGEVLHRRGS